MGKIYHKEIPKDKRKQSLPPPKPTIEKVEDNPVPSIKVEDYYKCDRCNINSQTPNSMCPCPRGSCEAKIIGKIEFRTTILLNGVETNKEQPKKCTCIVCLEEFTAVCSDSCGSCLI